MMFENNFRLFAKDSKYLSSFELFEKRSCKRHPHLSMLFNMVPLPNE